MLEIGKRTISQEKLAQEARTDTCKYIFKIRGNIYNFPDNLIREADGKTLKSEEELLSTLLTHTDPRFICVAVRTDHVGYGTMSTTPLFKNVKPMTIAEVLREAYDANIINNEEFYWSIAEFIDRIED